MRDTYLTIQGVVAAIIAFLSDKLGILFPVLALLIGLMITDYISGMLASMKEADEHPGDPAYGWNSAKGAAGIMKKFGYIFVIGVSMVVDFLIVIISQYLGIQIPVKVFFGLLVIVWYILNESLSIIENAGRMGAPIPDWLRKYIAVLKKKIDDQAEVEDGGSDP